MDNGVEMPLYNPWAMEWAFCCTTHESWGGYTVVQSMGYGVDILLYNPWSMVRGYPHTYCTTHYPWTINFPWSMGCTTRCTTLHTPCTMRSCHIVSPMYHGEKVAEGALLLLHHITHSFCDHDNSVYCQPYSGPTAYTFSIVIYF